MAVEAFSAILGGVEYVGIAIADDMTLFGIVQKLRSGKSAAATGIALIGVMNFDGHQTVRVFVRKGLKQDVVNNAEDGSGGPMPRANVRIATTVKPVLFLRAA